MTRIVHHRLGMRPRMWPRMCPRMYWGMSLGISMGMSMGMLLVVQLGAASTAYAEFQSSPPLASPAAETTEATAPPPTLAPGDVVLLDAGDRTVRLRLETTAPETGLPLIFVVDAVDPDGRTVSADTVALPPPGAVLGDFEVLAAPAAPSDPGVDRVRRWAIRTFGSGEVELPAIDVDIDGRPVRTEPRTITVASVAGLDTDPTLHRDIAGAVEVLRPGSGPVPWLIAGLAMLAATAATIWWWRRPPAAIAEVPADRWALDRIDALLAEGLVDQGRVKAFYVALTDIVRSFMERRYDLAAPDRTTKEFIEEARRHPELGDQAATLLGNLLKAADMVKFAGDRPRTTDCDRAVETIRRFVIEAGPRPADEDSSETGVRTRTDHATTTPRRDPGDARHGAIADAIDGLDRLERRS